MDGEVAYLVQENLRRELDNMELFLRFGVWLLD
jgi:hypothetical protein